MVSDLEGAAGLVGSPLPDDEAESPRLLMGWLGPHAAGPSASQQQQTVPLPAPAHVVSTTVPSSAPITRTQSPFPLVAVCGAASEPPSRFVPLSEMGGDWSSGAAGPAVQLFGQPGGAIQSDAAAFQQQQQHGELSTPARDGHSTGYDSGDDMDFLSMRHCINCTASLSLVGGICMDCGHDSHDDAAIFDGRLLVEDAPGSRWRGLQGDALVALSYDERMELHEEGGNSTHPERPDRIRAVMARLHAAGLVGRCMQLPSRPASRDEIVACHSSGLLVLLDSLSEQARLVGSASLPLNADTYINQYSAECARLSAGSCVEVARAVVQGEARAGVAICRPPGHHAESNTSMGFCLFNNAGIAARAAQAAGAERVLILDWDVHHGNGTQEIFEDDPTVMYVSLHRYDSGCFYPGTGAAQEVGRGAAAGRTVNIPWPSGGMRNGDYLAAFQHVILPIAYEFHPDLVIISAGFDAAENDPIGGCHLSPECFGHMTAMLQLVAPTVALLEGGYNLLSTARGMEACVRVLLGERPPPLPEGQEASEMGMAAVALAMRTQARYWRSIHVLLARVQGQLEAVERAATARVALAAQLGDGGSLEPVEGQQLEQHQRRTPGLDELDELGEMEDAEDDTETPHQQHGSGGGTGWSSGDEMASDHQEQEAGPLCEPPSEPQLPAMHATPVVPLHAASSLGQDQEQCGMEGASDGETDLSQQDGIRAGGTAAAALCEGCSDITPLTGEVGLPTPPVLALAAASSTPGTGVPASASATELASGWQARAASDLLRRRLAPKAVQLKLTAARPQRLSPPLGEEVLRVPPALQQKQQQQQTNEHPASP